MNGSKLPSQVRFPRIRLSLCGQLVPPGARSSFQVTTVTRKRTVAAMKTVTIRDFRTRPKQVRDALKREREAVLTANGRPVAVMIPVDAGSIDQTLETLRRARALEALRVIRQDSQRRGSARMSTREIDAIIAKTRKARSRAGAG